MARLPEHRRTAPRLVAIQRRLSLSSAITPGGLSGEAYRDLATPAPVAAEAAVVLVIEGERRLPDGRFGATVTVTYPSVPMPKQFFFFFTQTDGRLLIDGILGEISFSVP